MNKLIEQYKMCLQHLLYFPHTVLSGTVTRLIGIIHIQLIIYFLECMV